VSIGISTDCYWNVSLYILISFNPYTKSSISVRRPSLWWIYDAQCNCEKKSSGWKGWMNAAKKKIWLRKVVLNLHTWRIKIVAKNCNFLKSGHKKNRIFSIYDKLICMHLLLSLLLSCILSRGPWFYTL
jgi:hypothetical protein